MLKIEYEIKLNDMGRPYIHLSDDYVDKPEDKFMVLELTRYVLQNVYDKRSDKYDHQATKSIENAIILLGQISDEMAELIWEEMSNKGDMAMLFNKNYHFQVNTIEERNNLNYNGIIVNDKIFKREIGLKVLVVENMKIYKLFGGIDNENWVEI